MGYPWGTDIMPRTLKYPFDELPKYSGIHTPHLDAIRKVLPAGMKAYGGCGYGIFESAQDLVGFESLCIMQYTDPELFADLFRKIGALYEVLWTQMVNDYSDIFVFFRMGDDLGYRSSTMLSPDTIREHICLLIKRLLISCTKAIKNFYCTVVATFSGLWTISLPWVLMLNIQMKIRSPRLTYGLKNIPIK
jgi:hypothetical protein